MADLINTSFESYANGSAALIADGWHIDEAVDTFRVVSDFARTGSKSVILGADTSGHGQIQRRALTFGRSVTAEGWFYRAALATGGSDTGSTPILGGALVLFTNGSVGGLRAVVQAGTPTQVDLFDDTGTLIVSSSPGVVPAGGAWYQLRFEAYLSTVNATNDDVNSDGCLKVYANSVLVISLTGVRVYADATGWGAGNNTVTGVSWQCEGWLDDVRIADDVVACAVIGGDTPPPNESTPCCGTKPETPLGPNAGNPNPPLQPWERLCAGGGIVPQAADVVDAESWSL